jgi:hypothetical protein
MPLMLWLVAAAFASVTAAVVGAAGAWWAKPGDPTAGRPAYARSGIRMPPRTLGALRWR